MESRIVRLMKRRIAALIAGLALSGMTVQAHHSIAAVYDRGRPVTLDGTVVEFALVNPHPFLVFDVKGDSKTAGRWRGEMDNRFELVGLGVTAGTFKPGDRVVISGSRSRTETHALYILRLDRPADGYWYEQVGSTPRVGTH